MSEPSREMIEIQLGLWQVCRHLDTRDLNDGTFEKAIATLEELWARFRAEQQKEQADDMGSRATHKEPRADGAETGRTVATRHGDAERVHGGEQSQKQGEAVA